MAPEARFSSAGEQRRQYHVDRYTEDLRKEAIAIAQADERHDEPEVARRDVERANDKIRRSLRRLTDAWKVTLAGVLIALGIGGLIHGMDKVLVAISVTDLAKDGGMADKTVEALVGKGSIPYGLGFVIAGVVALMIGVYLQASMARQ